MSDWDDKADAGAIKHYSDWCPDGTLEAHRRGAQWQREQLLTDEAIERVARELCERTAQIPFEQAPGFIQEAWRGDARAAITALLGEDE